jgi:hypothetical protein
MSTSPFPPVPTADWRRQSDLTLFYGLFPSPALARDLFNIIEGQRIETLIRLAYPGIRRDMDLIQAQTLERREEMGGNPADLPEVGQVVDALMVSTMGAEPPFDDMSPHVRCLILSFVQSRACKSPPRNSVFNMVRVKPARRWLRFGRQAKNCR